jgi:thiamine transport system ATP-binding protein
MVIMHEPAQSNTEVGLRLIDVCIDYDGAPLLDRAQLQVEPPSIVALVGPSGCGKSSLLRCIAGVQQPTSGHITWNGSDITVTPAHKRRFGLVFQDPLLFDHLDVGANIAFGLRFSDLPRPASRARVATLLEMVGLPGFERRSVSTLSGGEAQRVALARALAPQPRLLCLDEPFAALDRDLRDNLVIQVRRLLIDLEIPAIHVTHDQLEAQSIADRVVRVRDHALVEISAR